jgi:hypothetical protein
LECVQHPAVGEEAPILQPDPNGEFINIGHSTYGQDAPEMAIPANKKVRAIAWLGQNIDPLRPEEYASRQSWF